MGRDKDAAQVRVRLFGSGPKYEALLVVARAITDLQLALERGHVDRDRLRRELGL